MPINQISPQEDQGNLTFERVESTNNSFVAVHYTSEGERRETYFVALSEEQFEKATDTREGSRYTEEHH